MIGIPASYSISSLSARGFSFLSVSLKTRDLKSFEVIAFPGALYLNLIIYQLSETEESQLTLNLRKHKKIN